MIVSNRSHLSKLGPTPAKPTPPPAPPEPRDQAELNGSSSGKGLTFAAVAGLCLLGGTALVQAQQAPATPQPTLAEQVDPHADLYPMEELQKVAREQGVTLQFRVRTASNPAKPISDWHAELILAEGGTVSVAENQAGQPERIAYLTDTTDLLAYLKYMRGDLAETAQENGAQVMRSFVQLFPDSQLQHPLSEESLSPFSAADRLAQNKPIVVRHFGQEIRLNDLREAHRFIQPDPGCDPTQTHTPKPGVYCLVGNPHPTSTRSPAEPSTLARK